MLLQPEFMCKEVVDMCEHESIYTLQDPEEYIQRVALTDVPQKIANNDYIDKLYENLNPKKILTMV
jgi:hypothetical protein